MPKRLFYFLLFITSSAASMAQSSKGGIVKGKLINTVTHNPFNDIPVVLLQLNASATSAGDGTFSFSEVMAGKYTMVIGGGAAKRDTLTVVVDKDVVDLGEINITPLEKAEGTEANDIPTIAIEENTNQEEENSNATSESSSGFYVVNQDAFLRIAALTFGTYRFRPRGYDNSDVQINGIPMQDQETGYANFSLTGGLNDVLKDRVITYGLRPSEFSFGTVRGTTQINATAADQRKGTTVSYYSSNRTFRNRVMATYSSGIMQNGWAYSVSGSRRWSEEGYAPGTFYDGYSFYGAVSKLTKNGQFNVTAFSAPTRRGKTTSETDEAFDLANSHFYNSAWGYQNGEKRNAHVADVNQPVFIANYTYKPNDNLRWNTAVAYEFGKNRSSTIDFYNGYNPAPNYYRNFPSYYLTGTNPNPGASAALTTQLNNHPELLQINWAGLYNANYTNWDTVFNANGSGTNIYGRQSIYALSNYVDDMSKIVFNSNIEKAVNEHVKVYGGVQAIHQKNEYYKELIDLLGGDFFVNMNQFAVQTSVSTPNYNQNNLNVPNQVVKVGDKYGYDYILRVLNTNVWGQGTFTYNRYFAFVAADLGYVSFSREGMYKNGLFPDNSFGKSVAQNFLVYKGKAGITYNLNLRNAVYLNGAYMTDAPRVDYTYISDRSRDITVADPKLVKTVSTEFGFLHKANNLNLRLSGYATDVVDNTVIKRFFNDDPAFQTFINYVMQGVNTRSIGGEFSANYKIMPQLDVTAVAAYGQTFYTNRPTVTVFQDNDPSKAAVSRTVYIKNYYVGVGPQSIYSLNFHYHPKGFWHTNLNFNYMDRNYVEINPDRRTQQAADMVLANTTQWNKIYAQEEMPGAFTVDLSINKSWNVGDFYKKLHHKTIMGLNIGVYNLLDNKDIKMTGYEQLRYDFANHNPDKFPNKYAYAYGINYYASLSFKF